MVFLVVASGIGMGINSAFPLSDNAYQYTVWWMVPVGLLCSAAMYCSNETPQFLMLKGKDDEAKTVLYHLRKGSDEKIIRKEFNLMKEDIDAEIALGEVTYKDLFSGFPLRIILITSLMQALQQWSGMNILNNFAPKLYEGVVDDPAMFGFIGNIIQLFGTIPSALIVDRVGRRPLLMSGAVALGLAWVVIAILNDTIIQHPEQCLKVYSCLESITDCDADAIFTSASMGIESVCSMFEQGSSNYTSCSNSLQFTPADTFNLDCIYTGDGAPTAMNPTATVAPIVGYAVLVMSYIIDFVFGFTLGPVVWSYNAEIAPTKFRAQILGLAAASNLFWTGAILYVPGYLISEIGFDTFWIFAGFMVIAFAFFYWIVETNGLPLEVVTEKWEKKLNCEYTNLHHTENGGSIDTNSEKEQDDAMA
jgi:MFS family permease